MKLKTALFDFDGVILNTEPLYDIFWDEAGIRYNTGIDHFAAAVKGTTLPGIMDKYFHDRPKEVRQKLINESNEYERTMPLPAMPGAIEFLRSLKEHGVRTGLVTSSDNAKTRRAFELHHLDNLFNTVVTANRITKGKPAPMCYLLAAKDLEVEPTDCIVFEDSFAGIEAGTSAGMRVIGVATTNPAESLKDKVYEVIDGFEGIGFEDYLRWQVVFSRPFE